MYLARAASTSPLDSAHEVRRTPDGPDAAVKKKGARVLRLAWPRHPRNQVVHINRRLCPQRAVLSLTGSQQDVDQLRPPVVQSPLNLAIS